MVVTDLPPEQIFQWTGFEGHIHHSVSDVFSTGSAGCQVRAYSKAGMGPWSVSSDAMQADADQMGPGKPCHFMICYVAFYPTRKQQVFIQLLYDSCYPLLSNS